MCIDLVFLSLSAWHLVGRVDRWLKRKKGDLIPQGSALMLLLYMILPILWHFTYIYYFLKIPQFDLLYE